MTTDPLYRDPSQPIEARTEDLLARMTLSEKVGQMLQLNGQIDPVGTIERIGPGSLLHILNDRLAQAMDAAAQTRLGIPLLIGEDGIHGHSFHPGATIFPTQLALACSWNEALVEEVARITAKEMAVTGAHWTFSPVLCLTRDQRWGRTGETFGEDPYLIGELGAAMIRGYQGRGLDDPESVLACAKHYAGYSETQGGRDASEADLSRRKLRSYFLPPFKRAVQAGCMTFMTGYQSMDGLPSTANHWLLTDVLKNEWGFQGIVVTDWDNVARLHYEQQIAPSLVEAAVIAIRCGNDLMMATPGLFEAIPEALGRGLIEEREIDVIVRRILTLKFKMGLFENPRRPSLERAVEIIGQASHREVALKAARESIVLLKNDGLLPLDFTTASRITVVGPNADSAYAQLGDWSLGTSQYGPEYGSHPRGCTVTVLDALRERIPGATIEYESGGDLREIDLVALSQATKLLRDATLTLVVVGDDPRFVGETRSTATLELPGTQRALIDAAAATGRPFILVLIGSKPLILPPSAERAKAILQCFNPGMLGGKAIVDILSGDVVPSGKLTISHARHVGQQPIFYSQVRGQHGSKYADLTQEPLYHFGHGLSYTTFEYRSLRLAQDRLTEGQALNVSVELQNTGERDGTEIVQAYLTDLVTSATSVQRKLVAFARVDLRRGETREVRFQIAYEQLALVDHFEQTVVEPGEFELLVGASSRPAQCLSCRFTVEGETFSFHRIPGVMPR